MPDPIRAVPIQPAPVSSRAVAASQALPNALNAITLNKTGDGPAQRQLAALVSTGLISPEEQRVLAVATTNLDVMKRVASNPGERHFGRIDMMVAVKAPTPIAQAREVLAQLNEAWDGMSHDFHHFRKRYYEGKAAMAKLAAKRRKVDALKARAYTGEGDAVELEDEAAILEAECEYEQSVIDEIQHDVSVGQAKLQGRLTAANQQSQQYALICQQAGKDPDAGGFTEDDFLAEEIDYYLKSAWWCASEQFKIVDTADKWIRHKEPPRSRKEEFARNWQKQQDGTLRVHVEKEVRLFFEGMGINDSTIKAELGKLAANKAAFETWCQGVPQDFTPNFLSWIEQMLQKYRPQAQAAYRQGGRERLKRLAALLDPKDKEYGKSGHEEQGRTAMIE